MLKRQKMDLAKMAHVEEEIAEKTENEHGDWATLRWRINTAKRQNKQVSDINVVTGQ